MVQAFEGCDYVVAPSGSCAGMAKVHYPELFAKTIRLAEAQSICNKVYELTTFLTEVADYQPAIKLPGLEQPTITYHGSRAGSRELGIKQ